LFVLTRILQEAGKANKTVYVLSQACDTVWRDGPPPLLRKCGWKVMAGPARPSY
jgi:hypothetical protein